MISLFRVSKNRSLFIRFKYPTAQFTNPNIFPESVALRDGCTKNRKLLKLWPPLFRPPEQKARNPTHPRFYRRMNKKVDFEIAFMQIFCVQVGCSSPPPSPRPCLPLNCPRLIENVSELTLIPDSDFTFKYGIGNYVDF